MFLTCDHILLLQSYVKKTPHDYAWNMWDLSQSDIKAHTVYSIRWLKQRLMHFFLEHNRLLPWHWVQSLVVDGVFFIINFYVRSKSIMCVFDSWCIWIHQQPYRGFIPSATFFQWTMRMKQDVINYSSEDGEWTKETKGCCLDVGQARRRMVTEKKDGQRTKEKPSWMRTMARERCGGEMLEKEFYLFSYLFIQTLLVFIYLFIWKAPLIEGVLLWGSSVSTSIKAEEDKQMDEGEEKARLHFWRSRTHLRHFHSWKLQKTTIESQISNVQCVSLVFVSVC